MYSWPNFKAGFYQDNQLTAPTLIIHSEARYSRYRHRQLLLKYVQQCFFCFRNTNFVSIFLIPFSNDHYLWSATFRKTPYEPIDSGGPRIMFYISLQHEGARRIFPEKNFKTRESPQPWLILFPLSVIWTKYLRVPKFRNSIVYWKYFSLCWGVSQRQ